MYPPSPSFVYIPTIAHPATAVNDYVTNGRRRPMLPLRNN